MSLTKSSVIAKLAKWSASWGKPNNDKIRSIFPDYKTFYSSFDAVRVDVANEKSRQDNIRIARAINRPNNPQAVGNFRRKRSELLHHRRELEIARTTWGILTTGKSYAYIDGRYIVPAKTKFEGSGFYSFFDGEYIYTPVEIDNGNWEKYGRRSYWHKNITDRYVKQEKFIEGKGIVEIARHDLDSFRGDWYAKSLLALSGVDYLAIQKMLKIAEENKIVDCYKTVAIREDGVYVSVFAENFTYTLNEIHHDSLTKTNDEKQMCKSGGIFVHRSIASAKEQEYPDSSKNATLPRVVLKGYCYGRKNENGKIAAEYFVPTEVVA